MVRVQVLSPALAVAMTAAATCYGQTKQASDSEQDVVSASTLKRTYTIQPAWPEAAVGVEGWVQLRFTLDEVCVA